MTRTKRSKTKAIRQPHQKKPVLQRKSLRGKPEIYDELKQRTTVGLTPTAIARLDQMAAEMGISRSELVERIGRGILKLAVHNSEAFE